MAKKHRVYLPSLSKSTAGKPVAFPLLTKLEKRNVKLLEQHGYRVDKNVKVTQYRVLPQSIFTPFLLFMYMLLQDILKGSPFNSSRYPFFLMFLQVAYGYTLNERQKDALNDFLEKNGSRDMQVNGQIIRYQKKSSEQELAASQEEKQEVAENTPAKKKVIILSSDYAGVGKSTFSKNLIDELGEERATNLSIADEIRSQLAYIFSVSGISPTAFLPENYNQTKNNVHSYSERFNPFILRELICDYSNVLQKHFGDNYWASLAEDFINDVDYEFIVIDDVRRPIELNYLRKQFGTENVLTVYLTKEDAVKPVLTGSSLGYEGQLDPNEYDIQFEFNSDWSNSKDLIKTITERL